MIRARLGPPGGGEILGTAAGWERLGTGTGSPGRGGVESPGPWCRPLGGTRRSRAQFTSEHSVCCGGSVPSEGGGRDWLTLGLGALVAAGEPPTPDSSVAGEDPRAPRASVVLSRRRARFHRTGSRRPDHLAWRSSRTGRRTAPQTPVGHININPWPVSHVSQSSPVMTCVTGRLGEKTAMTDADGASGTESAEDGPGALGLAARKAPAPAVRRRRTFGITQTRSAQDRPRSCPAHTPTWAYLLVGGPWVMEPTFRVILQEQARNIGETNEILVKHKGPGARMVAEIQTVTHRSSARRYYSHISLCA